MSPFLRRLPMFVRLSLLGLVAASGCSEELGPERLPTTRVTGFVRASGRPLGRGWVELQPFDGALGDPVSARIESDGRFHFDRAPIGQVAVKLVDIPIDLGNAIWLFRNNSPIHRDTRVAEGPSWTIDVADELVRHRSQQGRPQ